MKGYLFGSEGLWWIFGISSPEGRADKTWDSHLRILLWSDLEAPPKSIKPATWLLHRRTAEFRKMWNNWGSVLLASDRVRRRHARMIQARKTWTQLLIWLLKDTCSLKSCYFKKPDIFGAVTRSFMSSALLTSWEEVQKHLISIVKDNILQVLMTSDGGQTVDTCHLATCGTKMSFSQRATDIPSLPPHWKGLTFPPSPSCLHSKMQQLFPV